MKIAGLISAVLWLVFCCCYCWSRGTESAIESEILSIDKLFGEILHDRQLSTILATDNSNEDKNNSRYKFGNREIVQLYRFYRFRGLFKQTYNQRIFQKHCYAARRFRQPNFECFYFRLLNKFVKQNRLDLIDNDYDDDDDDDDESSKKQTVILGNSKQILLSKYKNLSVLYQDKEYIGENNVEQLLNSLQNSDSLADVWLQWNEQLKSIQNDFITLLQHYNRHNLDPTKTWNNDLKIEPVGSEVELAKELWSGVEKFYRILEEYIIESLNNDSNKESNKITIDSLQTFSGVQFEQIFEQIKPYQITNKIFHKSIPDRQTFHRQIVEIFGDKFAERIFQNSRFSIELGRNRSCHPLTFDMFETDDYSVFMRICLNSLDDESSFRKIVHEFGHVLYFNSYRKQPNLYKLLLPNSAVHESIGDVFYLLYTNCQTKQSSIESRINGLMNEALNTFVRLPFALSLEEWRASLFGGRQDFTTINRDYWRIRNKYQNIIPRDYSGLQALSKFHVVNFMPYLRYYFSVFSTHQIYEALCGEGAGRDCCLNSTIVHRLDRFLTSDLSQFQMNWKILTGKEWNYNSGALLRYYKPLIQWLQTNKNIKINTH